ncbi:MAG: glycosyltransferase [Candidatus Omnitrophota bacterium]
MSKKVAVIVPAKGIPNHLAKCLDSLLNLDYPDYEIIIVDDGIDGVIPASLMDFKGRIKILKSDSRGPSFARNLAAQNTDAELLAFTDSDCIVARDWLKELVMGLAQTSEAAACGGMQELPDDASGFQKYVFSALREAGFVTDYSRTAKDSKVFAVRHNPSCNVIYHKKIFFSVGGFWEGFWPGEDLELDYRLIKKGYLLLFNPRAVVYHYRPDTLRKFLSMMHRYGEVQAYLVRRYGLFRKIHLVPVGLVICILFIFIGGLKGLLAVLSISAAIEAAIIIHTVVRKKSIIFGLITGALCFLAAIYWNLGFLCGIFTKSPLKNLPRAPLA